MRSRASGWRAGRGKLGARSVPGLRQYDFSLGKHRIVDRIWSEYFHHGM